MAAPIAAAAAVNPYIGLGIAGLNAVGGITKPAGPSSADAVFSTNLGFDNSGWNIAFPDSVINSTSDKTSSQGGAGGASGILQGYLPWAMVFVGGLIAWKMLKKA